MTVNVWRFSSYQPITPLSRYRLGVLCLGPLLALTTRSERRPGRRRGQFCDPPPPTSDASDKAQVVACASGGRAVRLVAPTVPSLLRFNNLLGRDSWNPGKHFISCCYRSVRKETTRESPRGREAWGRRGSCRPRSGSAPAPHLEAFAHPEFPEPVAWGMSWGSFPST